jgi:hypothetical protein
LSRHGSLSSSSEDCFLRFAAAARQIAGSATIRAGAHP